MFEGAGDVAVGGKSCCQHGRAQETPQKDRWPLLESNIKEGNETLVLFFSTRLCPEPFGALDAHFLVPSFLHDYLTVQKMKSFT